MRCVFWFRGYKVPAFKHCQNISLPSIIIRVMQRSRPLKLVSCYRTNQNKYSKVTLLHISIHHYLRGGLEPILGREALLCTGHQSYYCFYCFFHFGSSNNGHLYCLVEWVALMSQDVIFTLFDAVDAIHPHGLLLNLCLSENKLDSCFSFPRHWSIFPSRQPMCGLPNSSGVKIWCVKTDTVMVRVVCFSSK